VIRLRLWEDYQAFASRDLSEYEIVYLFVDGIALAGPAPAKPRRSTPHDRGH
jgi:hypothetical protein